MNGFVNFRRASLLMLILLMTVLFFCGCQESSQIDSSGDSVGRQTMCPVMKNVRIDPTLSVMYKGKKVYFCCESCVSKFKANPARYEKNLPQFKE
jgi:YHS domain-containing protein